MLRTPKTPFTHFQNVTRANPLLSCYISWMGKGGRGISGGVSGCRVWVWEGGEFEEEFGYGRGEGVGNSHGRGGGGFGGGVQRGVPFKWGSTGVI
jgi:hypothetical protein